MKHKCTEAREREMSLMWVCSCGEQKIAEEQFTEDERQLIETLCNLQLSIFIRMKDDRAKEVVSDIENLLEKARKM